MAFVFGGRTWFEPFGSPDQVDNMLKQVAFLVSYAGVSPTEALDLPTDMRELLISDLTEKLKNEGKREQSKFDVFFKSLGKMFSGK